MSRLPVFPPGHQRSDASSVSEPLAQSRGVASRPLSGRSSASPGSASSFEDLLTEAERVAALAPASNPLIAQATAVDQSVSFGLIADRVVIDGQVADLQDSSDAPLPEAIAGNLAQADPGTLPIIADLLQAADAPRAVSPAQIADGALATSPGNLDGAATGLPPNSHGTSPQGVTELASLPSLIAAGKQQTGAGTSGRTTQQTQPPQQQLASPASTGSHVATIDQVGVGNPAGELVEVDDSVRVVSLRSERLPAVESRTVTATIIPGASADTATATHSFSSTATGTSAGELHVEGITGGAGLDVSDRGISEAGSHSEVGDTARIEAAQLIESRNNAASVSKVETTTVSQQIARTVVQRVQWETVETRTQMTLELQPAHLGTVQVVLELDRKELSIQIITQSESIRSVVEAQLNDLTLLLRQAGIDFSGCDVTCQDSETDKWDTHGRRPGPGSGQPAPGDADDDPQSNGQPSTQHENGTVDLVA